MKVELLDRNGDKLSKLWQWDLNRSITVSGIKTNEVLECHFANQGSNEALNVLFKIVDESKIEVSVPNKLLSQPYGISLYIYTKKEDEEKTEHKFTIPVKERQKPSDLIISEETEEDLIKEGIYERILDLEMCVSKKVDKETGKFLSSNDFSDEYKLKIDNQQLNKFEEIENLVFEKNEEISRDFKTEINKLNSNKVEKETGKKLSSNDFTNVHKQKINDAITIERKINNKTLSSDITLSASDVQAVPNTRKINGVSLGSDMVLTAENIHAYNKPAWLNLVYPVGSIYMSMISTNPNTLFGTGTWKQIAQGRTLIGIDSSDGDFNTVGKTGGSKTKTLSVNEMPQVNVLSKTGASLYTTKGNQNAEIGGLTKGSAFEEDNTKGGMRRNPPDAELITEGGNQAFSIVQPYLTCYIWQRTA